MYAVQVIMVFREDFPFYYDAIHWAYKARKDWPDNYRYSILKASKTTASVDVSITYLFTGEALKQIGINSKFAVSLIVSYLTMVRSFSFLNYADDPKLIYSN